MTIEEMFADINSRGWLLQNLFQHNDGKWQANIRSPVATVSGAYSGEFAYGETAAEALTACIFNMSQLRNRPVVPWGINNLTKPELKALKAWEKALAASHQASRSNEAARNADTPKSVKRPWVDDSDPAKAMAEVLGAYDEPAAEDDDV